MNIGLMIANGFTFTSLKLFLIVLVIFMYGFSGSYSSRTIDNVIFVVGLAIDVADDNENLKVSFGFTNMSPFSQGSPYEKPDTIYYRENISFTMKDLIEIKTQDSDTGEEIIATRDAEYFEIIAVYDQKEGVAAAAFTVFSLDPSSAHKDKTFLKMLDDYPFKEQHIRLILLGEGGDMNFHPKRKSMRVEFFKPDGTSIIQSISAGVSSNQLYRLPHFK